MDMIDNKLVTELRRDARASIVRLARAVGLSRTATQARITRLLAEGVISGFTIREGARAAQTAHVLIKFKTGNKCAQVVPRLKPLAGIIAIHSVAGEHDLVLQIEAAINEGIGAIRKAISEVDGIADVTTMIVLERHLN